jgi:fermentation-respiration switch protein FrsA (DUF1100 family)
MSAGGMAALRRLCDPHPFAAAAVEGTTGWLSWLYSSKVRSDSGDHDAAPARWIAPQEPATLADVDPAANLRGFRPIPILFLHAEMDRVIPLRGMERFVDLLRVRYRDLGVEPSLVETRTWRETGAPEEHAGFGRFGNDAKNAQTEFLTLRLRPAPPPSG